MTDSLDNLEVEYRNPGLCSAVLILRGESFRCDWPTDNAGSHVGWGHANRKAEAVWTNDRK